MISFVTALSAPSTLKRCRPEGVLIQTRATHCLRSTSMLPKQNAPHRQRTLHAGSLVLELNAVRDVFLKASCASGSALAGRTPAFKRLNPHLFFKNKRTCVGERVSPVNSAIAARASLIEAGG